MAKRLLAGWREWSMPAKDGKASSSGVEVHLLKPFGDRGNGYAATSYSVDRDSAPEVVLALGRIRNYPVECDVDIDIVESKNGAFGKIFGLSVSAAPSGEKPAPATNGRERAAV